MNFRIENKYLIDNSKLYQLYSFIQKNFGKTLFPKRDITSIYFDNHKFDSYNDSIEGTVPRKKIRARFYNFKNLDIKTFLKKTINFEIKINSPIGKLKDSFKCLDLSRKLKNGYYDEIYGNCKPVVVTNYKREYYELFNVRLTIDTNLRYSMYNKYKNNFRSNQSIIFEIKSNNTELSNYIDEKFFFQKIRFSKYCNAIEEFNLN